MFNKNAVKQGYEFGASASDIETIKQGWFVSDFMPVKATTYYISGKKTGNGCKLYNKDKVFVKNIQAPFGGINFDDGISYFRINGEIKDLDKIQVEEGNAATAYEPYGYLLELKVTGKNLLNLQKEPDVKGLYQGWKVGDGEKTIVLSIKDKGNNADIRDYSLRVTGNGVTADDGLGWAVQNGVIRRSEIKTINPYVSIYPPNETSVQKFLERFDIQVEYGETATSYEPYTEQTVQIALDEPLRGIGEYKDTITKDGVVRKIAHEVGNINCEFYDFVADKNFYKIVFTPKYALKNDKQYTIQCNISPHMVSYEKNPSIYWLPTTEEIKSMGIDIKGTMKDANAKLLEYISKNPIELQYGLKTPTTEPLPESVQQQLQALHSYNGTTHVFVDSGEVEAGIKLTYRKEK